MLGYDCFPLYGPARPVPTPRNRQAHRMNVPSRRLDRILTDHAVTASLLARVAAGQAAAQAIAPLLSELLPGFDPLRPGACDVRGRTLRIWLRSNAQSTKLRQAGPRLIATLQQRGLDISEIRFGIQPRNRPGSAAPSPGEDAQARAQRQRSLQNALAFSEKLAPTLHDGTLRESVRRLRRTVERRLAETGAAEKG